MCHSLAEDLKPGVWGLRFYQASSGYCRIGEAQFSVINTIKFTATYYTTAAGMLDWYIVVVL